MTKKFRVYGIMSASVFMGEFEAENVTDAVEMAYAAGEYTACLCHQCASHIELNDIYEEQVEEV